MYTSVYNTDSVRYSTTHSCVGQGSVYAGSGLPGQGQWEGQFLALLCFRVDRFEHYYLREGLFKKKRQIIHFWWIRGVGGSPKVDKRLSKNSVTFKTHNGDNCECFKKIILKKVIVPCDIYMSYLS